MSTQRMCEAADLQKQRVVLSISLLKQRVVLSLCSKIYTYWSWNMRREASDTLDHWLQDAERKPLVLRGARQTGKTWIIRDLAKRHELHLIEINFERNPEYASYFSINDPLKIIKHLSSEFGKPIDVKQSVLFLDEIQAVPEVFASLRWFKEEMPELAVVAAGSLLDFVLHEHAFSMPVGRISYLYLEPMSFFEFVCASDNIPLYEMLKSVDISTPLHENLHLKCIELYKDYCLCGGMPEVVMKWFASMNLHECQRVQGDLLATFQDDFSKYEEATELLRKTFRSTADQLGSKFILTRVDEAIRSYQIKKALDLLSMARVVSKVQYTAGNGLPLAAEINEKFFKVIFVDIGLVSSMLGLGRMHETEARDLVFQNKGALAEQFVGQQLRFALAAQNISALFYWQRMAGRQGEIDYIIQRGNRVLPIEVKSGSKGTMKSLHQFMYDKKLKVAVRFDLNNLSKSDLSIKTTEGNQVQYTLCSVPVYLAERIFSEDWVLE